VTGVASGVESLLAGLLGATISLQLDATARAERRFELRRLLADPHWLGEVMTSASDAAREIGRRYPGTVLEDEAKQRLQRAAAGLAELTGGSLVREHGDYQDLFEGTRRCTGTLHALTNVAAEPQWWTSEVGRSHWRLNEAALARGVRIRRVFIGHEPTDPVLAVMREQARAGVEVSWARVSALPRAGHLNLVVWDGSSAWRAQMSPHGEIAGNVFVLDRQAVHDLERAFELCAMHATPFPTLNEP
jgi:hypothetical protein